MDKATMAACFAEWQRRYQADPGAFGTEWPKPSPEGYGAEAAEYMEQLAADLAQPHG